MLINIADKILSRYGKTAFTKQELSTILSVYSDRVKSGKWKDYAIDTISHIAVFYIYKSSREQPSYSILKISGGKKNQSAKYQLRDNEKMLKESPMLVDVIEMLKEQK